MRRDRRQCRCHDARNAASTGRPIRRGGELWILLGIEVSLFTFSAVAVAFDQPALAAVAAASAVGLASRISRRLLSPRTRD